MAHGLWDDMGFSPAPFSDTIVKRNTAARRSKAVANTWGLETPKLHQNHVVSKSGSLASQDSRSSWSEYLLSAAANGAQRCPTVPNGAQRCPMVPNGAQRCPMVPNGAQWCPMVPNIPRRFLFSTRHSNWTNRFEQDFVTSVLTTDLAAAGKAGNQFICAVDIWWSEHLASPKAGRSKPWHSCRLTSGSVTMTSNDPSTSSLVDFIGLVGLKSC